MCRYVLGCCVKSRTLSFCHENCQYFCEKEHTYTQANAYTLIQESVHHPLSTNAYTCSNTHTHQYAHKKIQKGKYSLDKSGSEKEFGKYLAPEYQSTYSGQQDWMSVYQFGEKKRGRKQFSFFCSNGSQIIRIKSID